MDQLTYLSEIPQSESRDKLPQTESLLKENSADNETPEECSDLNSDLEPDQMIDKYVNLKRRLHDIDPQLVTDGGGSARKSKGRQKTTDTSHLSPSNRRAFRIRRQIEKLESDILFDKQKADTLWASIHIDLKQRDAERKRLGMDNVTTMQARELEKTDTVDPSIEDPEVMLGEMFASLPDPETAMIREDGARNETTDIQMRRFNTWTGVSPRRVLEEACKAR